MDSGELAQAVERVVRRCQRAGLSRAEAEDCVHEALLAMLTHHSTRDRLRNRPQSGDQHEGASGGVPVRQVEAWLTVTAHRKFVDERRRAHRECLALTRLHARTTPGPDPGEFVADQAVAAWLVSALSQLPTSTRQVCLLLAGGATLEQVADRLGLTRRSVQSHLTRARRALHHLAAIERGLLPSCSGLPRNSSENSRMILSHKEKSLRMSAATDEG